MNSENAERLAEFNDYYGKKIVRNHLLSKGVAKDKIFDTRKYYAVDLIVEWKNIIYLIEIKNRYCPPKYYRNLQGFALHDKKYESIQELMKELEVYHNKEVRAKYVNITQTDFYLHDITNLNLNELELQVKETQLKTGSKKKKENNFYQLPPATGKKNNLNKKDMNERDDYFSRGNWE